MDLLGRKIHNYIEKVEKHTNLFKQELEEEKKEIENTQRRVANLLNSFYLKENNEDLENLVPMKISLPSRSLFDSIFKEDTQNVFLFSEDREEKRKRLAAERRAEYNAYLEKKEQERQVKHKFYEEMSTTTTPRSILESVDYETVLAKRKEEESKFRQLNYAEPSLNDSLNNYEVSLQPSPRESEKMYPRETFQRPLSSEKHHVNRTGGGGEPVKDSFGNLITARGFKDITAPILLLPSFKQEQSTNKKDSYREELLRQIEEKKRLDALEKEKAQELENQLSQRIEEQRRQMQLRYENELKENNKIKEQRQQERLRKLEEFQRKESEMRQNFKENKQREVKNDHEKINENVTENRSSSPPIPAIRSKVIFEKATPVLSPTQRSSEVEVKPENIFSSLAEIRRKIMQDQQNLNKDINNSYEVMNRRTVQNISMDDEDYDIRDISEQQMVLKT